MRIDVLLDKLCIVKHRSIAKKACDNDLVQINGNITKPAKNVKEGDIIRVALYGFIVEFVLNKIPDGNIKKDEAKKYYKLTVNNQKQKSEKNEPVN